MPVNALAVLVAATLSAAQPAAPRRVAVLDFTASWSAECGAAAKLPQAQREQCEILRALADQARMGALAVLGPPDFVVMTRENTAQILKDMGGQCAEGECEVETARLLGASVVVSGEVMLLEGTYVVSLKVHDVATSALLGGGNTEAASKLEAYRAVRAETEKMLGRTGLGRQGGPAAPRAAATESEASPQPGSSQPLRTWYAEARGGYAPVVKDGIRPSGAAPTGRSDFGVRVGRRLTRVVALEGALMAMGVTSGSSAVAGQTLSVKLSDTFRATAAAAIWPMANRYFSIALELGWVTMQAETAVDGAGLSRTMSGVAFGVEARADYPVSENWYVGARAGFHYAQIAFDLRTLTAGGEVSVAGGMSYLPLSAVVGYFF